MPEARRTLEAAIKYAVFLIISRAFRLLHVVKVRPSVNYCYVDMFMCRYRLHRKLFIEKVIQALDIYQERILF
jgi:hypothetical protein